MRPIWLLVPFCLCRLANAQSGCPPIQFQGSATATAAPSSSSHVVVTRQPDGTYTAYEVTDASRYRIIRTTPNYAATLGACLPHRGRGPALVPSSANFGNTPGAASQVTAYGVLSSGNYLSIATTVTGVDAVEFDRNMQFVSENVYTAPALNSVLLVDLNGDGNLDLVGVNAGLGKSIANGSVVVMLGNGGTSFQATQTYPIGAPGVQTVAAGDFNGDHKLDLAVATYGFGSSNQGEGVGRVSILLGNGDGTFQAEQVRFNMVSANGVAVADLNGDGKADLAFTAATGETPSEMLMVALGNGDGNFAVPTRYFVGGSSLGIADVNGDGIPDVIAGGSILFGDGKGSFPTRRDYTIGSGLLFDFDGDGIPDMVGAVGNPFIFSGIGILTVEFGQGSAKFTGEPAASTANPNTGFNIAAGIATADFNQDGKPDLAVAYSGGTVSILEGAGDGFFTTTYQIDTTKTGNPAAIISGDFNHDGNSDLVVLLGFQAYLLVLLGDGHGNFKETSVFIPGRNSLGITAADFDGDGNLDVAVTSGAHLGPNGSVSIFLGDGQGNFNTKSGYVTGPAPFAIVAGDFNRDGKLDIAVTNQPDSPFSAGNVSLFFGKGDGTFTAGMIIPFATGTNLGPYNIVAADFNADGKLDLAVTISGEDQPGAGLSVLLGNGDGTFQTPAMYSATSAGLTVADLNGDGIPDLVLSATLQPGVGYLLGNGDGTFQPEVAIPTNDRGSGQIGPMVAVDLNHDGKVDLAGVGGPLGVAALLNISQPQPAFTIVSAASLTAGPVAPESIVTAFGKNLATGTVSEEGIPLPTTLAGTSVSVTDATGTRRPAPLLYVSPTQINFEIPSDAGTGTETVTIAGSNGATQVASVTIQPVAPSLFTLNAAGLVAANVISISNGVQSASKVYMNKGGAIVAAPISLAPDSVYLALYGTGIRGAAGAVTVNVQGIQVPVTFAGPQPGFPGLDQVNVLLPHSLAGSGSVSIVLSASGIESNTVHVSIQ